MKVSTLLKLPSAAMLLAHTLCIQGQTALNTNTNAEAMDSIGSKLLNEIIVNGQKYDFGIKSSQMGAVSVSNAQIRNLPMVFGEPDVLKTLQTTPGVQSGKMGNAGLMVRGGNYDQNNLMIDGAQLYSTEHMRGFVSAVNPDMVSSLAFYRGAFPARYSGRLSSIIDISATEGDLDTYHAEVSAGLSMGRVNVSGPIAKGRTSFMIASTACRISTLYISP